MVLFLIRRSRVVIVSAALCLAFATLAFAVPGPVTCALGQYAGFGMVDEAILTQGPTSTGEKAQFLALQSGAKARITKIFGTPKAQPIIIFLRNGQQSWPLIFNEYGSTLYVGSRACVIIGQKGRNLDVVAHELMHSEVFARVRFFRWFMEIPSWFDEGVAMQVDFRPRYNLDQSGGLLNVASVRALGNNYAFNKGNDAELTQHYAFAKAEVSRWLNRTGRSNLFQNLSRIRKGDGFSAVVVQSNER